MTVNRVKLEKRLKETACKTYKHNHPFHHVLNENIPGSEMVWSDLADFVEAEVDAAVRACAEIARRHHNGCSTNGMDIAHEIDQSRLSKLENEDNE